VGLETIDTDGGYGQNREEKARKKNDSALVLH
jgi:hypothetical protein